METLTITASSGNPAIDWLTFVLGLLNATAWPVAAIVIAIIFRQQIRELLARIRKGKIGPAEFEFEQDVRQIVEDVAPNQPIPPTTAPSIALASINPRASILEAWIKIEALLTQVASIRGISPRRGRGSLYQIRILHSAGLISAQDMDLFNDLRALRSQAAHDESFSPSIESTIQYLSLAELLISRLQKLVANDPPRNGDEAN